MTCSPNLTYSTVPQADAIAHKITALFATSDQSSEAEQTLQTSINEIIETFLQNPQTQSDVPLNQLIEQFTDSHLPSAPLPTDRYLKTLTQQVINHAIHTASPRFLGHMTAALPAFTRPLAQLMVALNQNPVKTETAKSLTPYERQALAKIHRLIYGFPSEFYAQHIQNPNSTLGVVTSGGTIANITALWCARNAALGPKGDFIGIEQAGLPAALKAHGYNDAVIIGSSLMHFSFEKAAGLLGIGTQGLIKIPANHKNQIDLALLKEAIERCRFQKRRILAIVGIAGTTDSGGIDPLFEMAKIAKTAKVHFHVDAAWGGPVLFSSTHRHKLNGITQADSVTIDGHKQLYMPMGIGMLFFKNHTLAHKIEKQAPYTVRKQSIDLGKRTLEGSRPATALMLQAGLKLIGRKGYEFLIDEGIRKTRYLKEQILASPNFELLAEPELNILIYRCIPKPLQAAVAEATLSFKDNQYLNQFNQALQKNQRLAGRTFVSRTTTQTSCYCLSLRIVALRAVIANPNTTESDINAVLHEQVQISQRLLKQNDTLSSE